MTIHKEGFRLITTFIGILVVLNVAVLLLVGSNPWIIWPLCVVSLSFLMFILWFFRNPDRHLALDERKIYAPADGKVVVIEETTENEYFKDKRIQVSIFMSPLNVHVNRYPVSGKVVYSKYHEGDYLVAWHPKSSTHNERTTVVVKNTNGVEILLRQIAGAVARRVVCYAQEGMPAVQGEDMGFIKFGSRVDLFLPLNAKINVELNQNVSGNITTIAYLES
jgi:phosphatidylserine decarboxylase